MNTKKILFIIIILLQSISSYANDNDTNATVATDTPIYIREIIFSGNSLTRADVIAKVITFKIGDAVDTAQINISRNRLINTRVFDDVEFIIHYDTDGATVEVALVESMRLDIFYGVVYDTHMYGIEKLWFEYILGVDILNIGGRLEELRVAARVWDRKVFELLWYKPLLPSRYFLTLGSSIDTYPDNMMPIDYTDLYARAGFGRMLGTYSRLSLGTTHIYRHRSIIEDSEFIDRVPANFRDEIYEAFLALSFSHDRREHRFDPRNGWFAQSTIATNRLYDGGYTPFFQLTNEARYYIPVLRYDALALRFKHQLRDVDAGEYHRMTRGGVGDVRGYASDELGWDFVANSNFMMSARYNKHLYTTPRFPMPLVDMVFGGIQKIRFRFDASLIADYLRLYEDPQGALTNRGQYLDGIGLGGGVRIMIPEIRQSGCIDLVYGRVENSEGKRKWEPMLHIYLDMFF